VTCVTINSVDIDLRGLPVWERPSRVFEMLDALPHGIPLTFITEIEPLGLSARIIEQHPGDLIVQPSSVGQSLWKVRISRTQVQAARHPIVRLLGLSPVFAGLEPGTLESLAADAVVKSARRGRRLVDDDAEWPFVGVVAEGVALLGRGGERERVLHELFPRDAFGIAEFFDRGAPMGHVVAVSKSVRIVALPWESLTRAAERHASRQRLLADTLASQSALPIIGRVARVLVPHAMPHRGLSPAMPALATMTQSQIAASAGTVKEVAARAIAELEARHLLKRERGHIRYLDRQGLIELIREFA
jgi:uncharacterized protein (DUF2249 family)/CRP-like cAMP-binding protein